jgi:hypothetical protein
MIGLDTYYEVEAETVEKAGDITEPAIRSSS